MRRDWGFDANREGENIIKAVSQFSLSYDANATFDTERASNDNQMKCTPIPLLLMITIMIITMNATQSMEFTL